jgi:NADPH-dependent 2,4-dienoyl-CoA reductase/sulfur reductase-like enzyme
MSARVDLAIIGGGPGGLAAASEAAGRGISVVLLDDNPAAGGQLFRRPPDGFRIVRDTFFDKEWRKADPLLKGLDQPLVNYRCGATVWGWFEGGRLAYTQGEMSGSIRPDYVIVSGGAYDRPVPFPGWTLPGVITAGAALNLLKAQRVLPGRRVLAVGNGPLLYLAAYGLHVGGAQVVEVLETSRPRISIGNLRDALGSARTLYEGFKYVATLRRARIPFRMGRIVSEARGDEQVREAVISRIDAAGEVERSHDRVIGVDAVVLGFGLIPSVEATRLLGCEHFHDPRSGGWIPKRSLELETSVPRVFAVGDCAGVRGGDIALLEGRAAAVVIASRLGRLTRSEATGLLSRIFHRLALLERFQMAMREIFAPPRSYLPLLTTDTILCRCEEVSVGQVLDQIRGGVTELSRLKSVTRLSMGPCQGRNCLDNMAELVARETGTSIEKLARPRPRPPLRPIGIEDLLHEDLPPPSPPEMKLS